MILTLFVGLLCFTYQAKAQWTVIDPSNLVQNIKSAVQSSTTATNMVKSLQEDALRILRLVRFCSVLGFSAEKETARAAHEARGIRFVFGSE